jgi:hypothetical protein
LRLRCLQARRAPSEATTYKTIFYKFYVFLLCNKELFRELRKVTALSLGKAAQLYDSCFDGTTDVEQAGLPLVTRAQEVITP